MIFWIYGLPLWVFALSILSILLAAMALGAWNGRRVARRAGRQAAGARPAKGDLEVGALLALLGLVLAFTYSFCLTRIDARKAALVHEANVIGTAFLRADLLPEPGRSDLKDRLLAYARTRVMSDAARNDMDLALEEIAASLAEQARLWPATLQAVSGEVPGHVQMLVVQAMNDVIDAHALRMAAGFDRMSPVALAFTVLLAALGIGLASQNEAAAGSLRPGRMSVFAAVLAGLIVLIADFDNSSRGLIQLRQDSLSDLIAEMETSPGP
ncbi:hypothetical protein [Poseidonocella sp. HB161398]|uniref:bestrophin-like domain n=1 Tax=Poseidonocella sp. HB161398 TaxID=2320855 RepID=UPI00110958C4|nr:hypothetical protein [Poseidonocella sp. HB161398]